MLLQSVQLYTYKAIPSNGEQLRLIYKSNNRGQQATFEEEHLGIGGMKTIVLMWLIHLFVWHHLCGIARYTPKEKQ